MLHQVDDALLHAMSGTELSRVRTELRLLLLSLTTKDCSRREEPTLLCNQVDEAIIFRLRPTVCASIGAIDL
jgi:hypothetical protein